MTLLSRLQPVCIHDCIRALKCFELLVTKVQTLSFNEPPVGAGTGRDELPSSRTEAELDNRHRCLETVGKGFIDHWRSLFQ